MQNIWTFTRIFYLKSKMLDKSGTDLPSYLRTTHGQSSPEEHAVYPPAAPPPSILPPPVPLIKTFRTLQVGTSCENLCPIYSSRVFSFDLLLHFPHFQVFLRSFYHPFLRVYAVNNFILNKMHTVIICFGFKYLGLSFCISQYVVQGLPCWLYKHPQFHCRTCLRFRPSIWFLLSRLG